MEHAVTRPDCIRFANDPASQKSYTHAFMPVAIIHDELRAVIEAESVSKL